MFRLDFERNGCVSTALEPLMQGPSLPVTGRQVFTLGPKLHLVLAPSRTRALETRVQSSSPLRAERKRVITHILLSLLLVCEAGIAGAAGDGVWDGAPAEGFHHGVDAHEAGGVGHHGVGDFADDQVVEARVRALVAFVEAFVNVDHEDFNAELLLKIFFSPSDSDLHFFGVEVGRSVGGEADVGVVVVGAGDDGEHVDVGGVEVFFEMLSQIIPEGSFSSYEILSGPRNSYRPGFDDSFVDDLLNCYCHLSINRVGPILIVSW